MKRPVCLLLLGLLPAMQGAPTSERTVVFVAGAPSHGAEAHEFPRGSALLAEALNQSGLPLQATVCQGWPTDERVVREADVLVLYSDGLDAHVAAGRARLLQERLAAGLGLAVLHFALEPPESDPALRNALLAAVGGVFEAGWSVNPTWTVDAAPAAAHPAARGVARINLEDEWYFHLRFADAIKPLLEARPDTTVLGADGPRSGNPAVRAALAELQPQVLAWTYHADNDARGFGFTGGHFHRNWYEEPFRRLVLNGLVWSAGLEVPAEGVASADPTEPLHPRIEQAIARGDAADVQRHLRRQPDLLNPRDGSRLSPLQQAILRRQAAIARLLIAQGADIHLVDTSKRTTLHLAVIRDEAELVELLLAQGVDATVRDQQGWTPLHHAASRRNPSVVRQLLQHGVDPNLRSGLGGTALHEAAAAGADDVSKLLLTAGVDPAIRSSTGVTAAEVARDHGHADLAALLDAAPRP